MWHVRANNGFASTGAARGTTGSTHPEVASGARMQIPTSPAPGPRDEYDTGGGSLPRGHHPPRDEEMTITKCRPIKVHSHSPGSLLSEEPEKALDAGHCCNPKNNVNTVLHVLLDALSQNAVHFSLILSHLTNWRTGCCERMRNAIVRHTCKGKSSGKLQFCNRYFVISGVRSLPPPHPHQNNCGSFIFIPAGDACGRAQKRAPPVHRRRWRARADTESTCTGAARAKPGSARFKWIGFGTEGHRVWAGVLCRACVNAPHMGPPLPRVLCLANPCP